jgi:hypothetical protein
MPRSRKRSSNTKECCICAVCHRPMAWPTIGPRYCPMSLLARGERWRSRCSIFHPSCLEQASSHLQRKPVLPRHCASLVHHPSQMCWTFSVKQTTAQRRIVFSGANSMTRHDTTRHSTAINETQTIADHSLDIKTLQLHKTEQTQSSC